MPLTPDEYEMVCKAACKMCAAGHVPKWRPETSEWAHDITRELAAGKTIMHSYCLATGIRKAYDEGKLNG